VPEEQIEAVRRMVEGPMRVDPWPYLQKGRRVRVKCGPLRGLEGYILRRKERCMIVVSVDLLGRSVAAEIAAECVEPA
jgi:transcription antitermination factor NusG